MRELPSLESLRDLLVFSEELNLTRTARRVGVSQPALHLRLSRLAEQLGCTLYRRRGRALVLTAEGASAAVFARQMLGRAGTFLESLSERTRDDVTIAGGEGAIANLLSPALKAFHRGRLGTLRVRTLDAPGTLAGVLAGEAHLGVGVFDTLPADVRRISLARVGYVFAVPRSHRIAHQKRPALTALEGEAIIAPPAGRPFRTVLDAALRTAGVRASIVVEASGWDVMLRFVELGLGVAIVSEFSRIPNGVVTRPAPGFAPVEYSLISDRTTPPSDAAARLQALIVEHRLAWKTSHASRPAAD